MKTNGQNTYTGTFERLPPWWGGYLSRNLFRVSHVPGYRSKTSARDWEEWQVDTLAGIILLPAECVKKCMSRFGLGTQMRLLNRVFAPSDYRRFEEMASFMGASKTALSIRMSQMGLLKRNDLHDPYALVRIEKDEEDGL